MPTNTFDRLTRLFGMAGTRRAALSALFGTALLAPALDTSAAKGKRKAKGKQRNQTTRKNNGDANAQAKTENHCTTPFGLDLNATYGISAQIVTSFCHEVGSGEQWISSGAPWFVNDTFESVPTPEEGFVPAGDTPVEDFIAKFTALKLVIDWTTRASIPSRVPSSPATRVAAWGGCWVVSRSADCWRCLGWLKRKPSTRRNTRRSIAARHRRHRRVVALPRRSVAMAAVRPGRRVKPGNANPAVAPRIARIRPAATTAVGATVGSA